MFLRKQKAAPEPLNYVPTAALQRRWRFWNRDLRKTPTFMLLQRIESACVQVEALESHDPSRRVWLLSFRAELHELLDGFDSRCNNGEVDIVRYYLLTCPRPMIAICIWLVGRFSDRMHLYELKSFRHSLSPQLRRHVAKALRRLEAWSLLREMAKDNPDDVHIQWFAAAPTSHRSFKERLKNFTSGVDDSRAGEVATPSQMPFWAVETFWCYTPPKSDALIRRMLRRIRHWVRWGVS
jgi:hypothetical protein